MKCSNYNLFRPFYIFFLALFSVLMSSCGADIVADLVARKGVVHIEVDGVGIATLYDEYKIVVYDQRDQKVATAFFNGKTNIINYRTRRLRGGQWYTFQLERQDRRPVERVTWLHSNKVKFISGSSSNKPLTQSEAAPRIKRIVRGVFNPKQGVWDGVEIEIENDHEDLTFTIGSTTQIQNVFTGLKPGTYTVTVKDQFGQTQKQTFTLPENESVAAATKSTDPSSNTVSKPVAAAKTSTGSFDVQKILDQVSRAEMTPSDAQQILANGSVDLAAGLPGDIKTLWGVLEEAGFGEFFIVQDYQLDPKTKKIKSGSLLVKKKEE